MLCPDTLVGEKTIVDFFPLLISIKSKLFCEVLALGNGVGNIVQRVEGGMVEEGYG
jgi:hypothetical protein